MATNLSIIITLDLITALLARYSFNNDATWALVTAMATLALAGYFFIKTLEHKVTIIMNALWVGLSTVLVAIAGLILFDENLSVIQVLAMSTIMIGVVLASYEGSATTKKNLPQTQ